jgi:soluble lytic murein transglycosylase-like protein
MMPGGGMNMLMMLPMMGMMMQMMQMMMSMFGQRGGQAGCGCNRPQFGPTQANPSAQIPNYGPNPNKAQINSMIEAACQKYGVTFEVAKAVAYKESGWNPRASSFDGGHGKGIMQIDDRSHAFARTNAVWDPAANIDYGVRLLAENFKKSGNWRDACRRYNGAGPMAERYANAVMGLTQTQPWQRFNVA